MHVTLYLLVYGDGNVLLNSKKNGAYRIILKNVTFKVTGLGMVFKSDGQFDRNTV